MPKKVQPPVMPPPKIAPLPTIRIDSMEAPLVNSNGTIVIEEQALANKQDVVP